MLLRTMSILPLLMLGTAALAAPQAGSDATASTSSDVPAKANLVPADELVGRTVAARQGERIGTLAYITLNLDEGNVSHLVIDTSAGGQPGTTPGDDGENDLLIVPWSVADLSGSSDQITIQASREQLADAPRLAREDLQQLAEPSLAAYVVDYWAPASEMAAMEREADAPGAADGAPASDDRTDSTAPRGPSSQSPQQDSTSSSAAPGAPGQSAPQPDTRLDPTTAARDSSAATDQQTAQRGPQQSPQLSAQETSQRDSRQAAPQTAQQPQQQQETSSARAQLEQGTPSEAAGAGGSTVLVGQEVVASVKAPLFQLGQDLQGTQVTDRSGQQIGEVRRILIDTDTGDAAYAVIERPEGSTPVPLQALEWAAEGITMLTADASDLQPDSTLGASPGSVDRQQLADLYQRFYVQPYWQRQHSAQAGGTAGERSTTEQPR